MLKQKVGSDNHEQPLKDVLDLLKSEIAQLTENKCSYITDVKGLSLFRYTAPSEPTSGMYEPSICVVVQGAKRVALGEKALEYDPNHYLITSVYLPTSYQVTKASPEEPFLGLKLTIDHNELSQLMADSSLPAPRSRSSNRGMAVGVMNEALANSFYRLIRLLKEPEDIPILAPIIQKEILYRLLVGEQGFRLRQIASAGSQSQHIARAIRWIKTHFSEPLRISELAEQASMSPSTFHQHFRSMTALSPIQFQKQLRLQEARRLMLSEHLDAASASFEVGYESPSQFSREYSRLFGAPPLRDIKNLNQVGGLETA